MSLEDKIQGLREAIDSLTAALTVPGIKPFIPDMTHSPPQVKAEDQLTLSGRTDTLSGRTDTLSEKEVAPPKSQPTASETSTSPTAKEKSIVSAATPETTSTPVTIGGIDYAQVAKAITDTFKVDRAKTIAALGKFGAAKGPQLKPEDYAAFLKELTA